MKLQTRPNRRVGNKEYKKWYVDIPADIVKETGWKEGLELEAQSRDGKLTLKPKKINSQ